MYVTKRFGRSVGDTRLSGRASESLSQESYSVSFDLMKLNVNIRFAESCRCTRKFKLWKYALPTLAFCSRTPPLPFHPLLESPDGNCGKRDSNCAGVVVADAPEINPANGFGVTAVKYACARSRVP